MRNLRITCEAKSNDKAKSNDDETKANFNKKVACKTQLLIKYRAKCKHLLPFHNTNNDLKQVIYKKCKLNMSNKIKDIDIKTKHTTFSMIDQYKKF